MSVFILSAVIFPIAAGLPLFIMKRLSEKTVRLYAFAVTVMTSLAVFAVILFGGKAEITLITFTDAVSFSFRADGLGCFFAGLAAFLWPLSVLYTFAYMKNDSNRVRYYGFYVMTYGVVLGIAFSSNVITLFFFYEILTFITLPLITHTETKEARKAGRIYLYYSLSGSSVALAGIVILIVTTGTGSFIYGGALKSGDWLSLFGYLLTFVGFGVKSAIFPLCRWLPMASAAPTPTTALLHAVAVVKSGAFAVIRMTFFFCTPSLLFGSWVQDVTVIIAAVTVVYGSCMSLKEQHFKRRFAYSTVSNLSYILLGALLATPQGLEASLLHFLMHSVTKIGIFFCIGAIMKTTGATYVYELNGMGKKAPFIFVCFTVSGLSLIGIPPFCGFVSKYYLINAALAVNSFAGYAAVGAIIISAILTAVYVLSVSFRAFVREPGDLSSKFYSSASEPSKGFTVIAAVFALLTVVLGLFGGTVENVLTNITGGGMI